ncbi:aldo/keto reductase [Streptomyces sp900116325]|uniref:aldo/keto reductase n=1 Tax=Streptomyces sp. 900116325 TaxID=3154295 RepID=UPI0033AC6E9C
MRYTTFGRRTGLRVSQYALGTGNFGTGWGAGAEPDEARRMFDRFAEAGGNFLDTADEYQFGESETMLGQFLGADRDDFVVATSSPTAPLRGRVCRGPATAGRTCATRSRRACGASAPTTSTCSGCTSLTA